MPKLNHSSSAGKALGFKCLALPVRIKFRTTQLEKESVSVEVVKLKASKLGLIKPGQSAKTNEKRNNHRLTIRLPAITDLVRTNI